MLLGLGLYFRSAVIMHECYFYNDNKNKPRDGIIIIIIMYFY